MDDQRWEPGMPVLDRQPVATPPGPAVRDRIPELAPTPLQPHYINLSFVALIAGAVATPLLVLANGDATLRIWRSAWAWMPVDRGRGLFRLAWVAAASIGLAAIAVAAAIVLAA